MSKLKEVFERLIPIYEDAIVNCPEDFKQYLLEKKLRLGICLASSYNLGIEIFDEMQKISNGYWHKPPLSCQTKAEAIDCLQWRVDKMKELIKNGTV